ncbi:MAG: toll/interleukin-1 receptor domain-containing protein, partial [Chlamydiia bacterium]|nr:toll/interleukin-1 receptor domain-containing protein [Chlamydiia bacterium]
MFRQGVNCDKFLNDVQALRGKLLDFQKCLPASEQILPSYEKEGLKAHVNDIAITIDCLYHSILDNPSITQVADEVSMLHAVRALEAILVDRRCLKFAEYAGENCAVTQQQICDHPLYSTFNLSLASLKSSFRPVTCYISYAPDSTSFVQQLKNDLDAAGIDICIDTSFGPEANRDLSKLQQEILSREFVLVIGSIEYGTKCRESRPSTTRDEARLISDRHHSQPDRILKVLLTGTCLKSFPIALAERQQHPLDFKSRDNYFSKAFAILEKLFESQLTKPELKTSFLAVKNRALNTLPATFLFSSAAADPPSLPPLVQCLRQSYQKFRYLERFIDMTPVPIEESFIQLALVQEEEQKDKERQTFSTFDHNSFEAIHKPKTVITLHELFQKDKTHLFIEGRAGIGKTTLCQYISYIWTKPELRKEKLGSWADRFELILWIPLRNLLQKE